MELNRNSGKDPNAFNERRIFKIVAAGLDLNDYEKVFNAGEE